MGRVDSPLRDRVIFIDGAPRSGTTWLITLLAMHPDIAGVQAESHLFDYGVDRLFDNFEGRDPNLRGLRSFTTRDQLVDLVRGLCDGVLMTMRGNVSGGPEPAFVIEKTPVGARTDGVDLERKRECYPDAWFLHIVRDREAVVKSLMRSPFMGDRSRETCEGLWDRVVGDIRRVLGDALRYRELPYEDLRADPVQACAGVFEWLGLDSSESILEVLRNVAPEKVSELGAVPPEEPESARGMVKAILRRPLERLQPKAAAPASARVVTFNLISAMYQCDIEAARELFSPKVEYVYRGPDGDRWVEGEEGFDAFGDLVREVFGKKPTGHWNASAGGAPGEFWTSEPDKPFCSVFVSLLSGDATRVDLAFGFVLEDDDLIRRMVVVSAGPVSGRPASLR